MHEFQRTPHHHPTRSPQRAGVASARSLALCLAVLALAPQARADDAERARFAASYALSVQQENGHFLYDFDFMRAAPTGQDNIVRQAGILYALAEFALETRSDAAAAAVARGLARMRELSLPAGKGRLQSALEPLGLYHLRSLRLTRFLGRHGLLHAEQPGTLLVAEPEGGHAKAPSGATALTLVAELLYHQATGNEQFAETRAAWVRGLLSLRLAGRGLRRDPLSLRREPYFDGEAWLALAHLHERFPDDAEAHDALVRFEDELLEWYGGEGRSRDFFHWAGMAAAVRQRSNPNPQIAAFLIPYTDWFLDETPSEKTASYNTCALLEGAASLHAALDGDERAAALRGRLGERIAVELAKARSLQIQKGQQTMELPADGQLRAPSLAEHAGAFLGGPTWAYTRIDVTQHCMSGITKALRVGLGELGPLAAD